MKDLPYHHLPDGTFRNPEGSPRIEDFGFNWSFKVFNEEKKKINTDVPPGYVINKKEVLENLKKYKNNVEKKNELICLSKCDLLQKDELKHKISELKNVCKKEIYFCSNITGEGIKEVLKKLENLYGKKKN